MNFYQAQQQFQQLETLRRAGQIDLAQYRAALASLRVVDSRGICWQMQEFSGAWYYFWDGRWVPGTPPVQPGAVPPARAGSGAHTPSNPVQPASYQAQRSPLPKKRGGLLALGLGLLTLLVIAGAVFLLKDRIGSLLAAPAAGATPAASPIRPTPTQTPPPAAWMSPKKLSETSVAADGNAVTDSKGVTIQVPPDALKGTSGGRVVVTVSELQGKLASAIASAYTIGSPAYTVEAEGQQDGTGRALLSFPAASADARILKIIDDKYLVMADKPPADGKFNFGVRLGPANTEGLKSAGGISVEGSQRYLLVTPKKGTRSELAPVMARRDAVPGLDCTTANDSGITRCRANEDKTVKVLWDDSVKFTAEEAYKVAKTAEAWMKKYAEMGFINADLSKYWFAMEIIILDGGGDPYYSTKSGSLYMHLQYAKNIGSSDSTTALGHELGHWIEDEAYKMCWAGFKSYVDAGNYWWLEVAADNMVMLADKTYAAKIMADYGKVVSSNQSLVWQMAINQWPVENFYAQSLLVKLLMCDSGGCVLNEKTFKDAVNSGAYPYNNSAAESKIGANLEDYARFLVGASPKNTNTSSELLAVSKEAAFGELVQVLPTNKLGYLTVLGDRKPQIQTKAAGGFDGLAFNVPLERNGVYPLTISSSKVAALPVMLVVEAGIPLVYRLDGGEVKTHSGDKPLTLGPISSKMGFNELRLAAYSSAANMTFKAQLQIIDVRGVWTLQAINYEKPAANTVVCDNPPKSGTDELYKLLPLYGNIAIAFGDFVPTTSADQLKWALVPKRLPPDTKSGDFSEEYSLEISADQILIKGKMNAPKKTAATGTGDPVVGMGGLSLTAAGLMGGAHWTWRKRKHLRGLACAGLAGMLALLLAGCMGFYGGAQVEIKITKLEAGNGTTDAAWNVSTQIVPDTVPVWTITKATGSYLVDSTTETDSNPKLLDDKKITTYNHCKGSMTFELKGGVYPDVTITTGK